MRMADCFAGCSTSMRHLARYLSRATGADPTAVAAQSLRLPPIHERIISGASKSAAGTFQCLGPKRWFAWSHHGSRHHLAAQGEVLYEERWLQPNTGWSQALKSWTPLRFRTPICDALALPCWCCRWAAYLTRNVPASFVDRLAVCASANEAIATLGSSSQTGSRIERIWCDLFNGMPSGDRPEGPYARKGLAAGGQFCGGFVRVRGMASESQ